MYKSKNTKKWDNKVKQTTSNQIVIPIYNGQIQKSCTFEEYVKNLADDQPTNWSQI